MAGGPETELLAPLIFTGLSTADGLHPDTVPAPEDDVLTAPVRLVPRKRALRVSGARLGSDVRPTESGAVAVSPRHRFGLRVHSSALAPRPAVAPALAPCDYATADDYE